MITDYTIGADGVLTRCHKIVLVGGDKKKTKLVEKLAQSDDQTLDPIGAAFRSIALCSYPNHSFDVWDAASSGKFRSLMGLYLRDAELAAICYDPECSEADLSQWFEDCVYSKNNYHLESFINPSKFYISNNQIVTIC